MFCSCPRGGDDGAVGEGDGGGGVGGCIGGTSFSAWEACTGGGRALETCDSLLCSGESVTFCQAFSRDVSYRKLEIYIFL